MNLDFKYRGQIEGLQGGSWIAQSIQALIHAVGAGWGQQHNGDGSHGVATFGSASGPSQRAGAGSPEGRIAGPVGSIYMRTDGGVNSTFYVKQTGVDTTGWYPVGASPATMQYATVTLTNAQIKALPTTPIQLVPAPASGYWNHVLSVSLRLQAGSGAYTNINTTYASLVVQTASVNWLVPPVVNDNTATPVLSRLTTFLGVAADYLVHAGEYVEGADSASGGADWGIPSAEALTSDFNGSAVQIALDNNGSGDLTGGHAANTLKVTVYYIVEAL